jgi:metallo-beta-lactamase family protein
MTLQITFLGGSDTVTGSKYWVREGKHSVLIDCGLFQGYKQLRLRNWNPLPLVPDKLDSVILTHAHLDHSGYLPLLIKEGFAGPVFATSGTRDLCGVLLPDSGHLQEEDAFFMNKHGLSKHEPALPLYTKEDAVKCLPQIKVQAYQKSFSPAPGWKATFTSAGHILGAASVLLEVAGKRILFSGDLGRPDDLLMYPPANAPAADVVLIESTYGNRLHPKENLLEELGPALQRTAARGGVAVMPVFAVGRAQAVLHAIGLLKRQGLLPTSLPVFLDSPMAVHTTELMKKHIGEHRLNAEDVKCLTHCASMIESVEESKALAQRHGPMVILSASGMATGGRVLHHLAQHASHHRNMIILTGYQAPGTRGATIAKGERTVRIHGQDVALHAEVVQLQAASAHADGNQLMNWLQTMPNAPKKVYVIHGDMEASDALRCRIKHELKWPVMVPEHGSTWAV